MVFKLQSGQDEVRSLPAGMKSNASQCKQVLYCANHTDRSMACVG